jgi:UrcA family protein
MFQRTLSALAAAALTAGTLALATPASAAEIDGEVAVSVSGLDLSTAADAARFERRVRQASTAVCGDMPARGIQRIGEVKACQDSVVANAKADAQTALAKNGGPFRLALRAQ